MKVHYINILLFELPLNILIYNQRNHNSTTPHHPPNTRLLCECEWYAPSNYDNDPQMKAVMQDFDRQTSQRFEEYNERLLENKQKCKEQCDKEIQKIILKDKLEKELAEKFVTLQTDIQSDAIPTCVCEKSVADKVEKTCLKCGGVLGGGVTPAWGLLSGIVYTGWKAAALAAAKELAEKAGAAEGASQGAAAGAVEVIKSIKTTFGIESLGVNPLQSLFNAENYMNAKFISESIHSEFISSGCGAILKPPNKPICTSVYKGIEATSRGKGVKPIEFIGKKVETMVSQAKDVAEATKAQVTSETTATLTDLKTGVVQTTYMGYQTVIIASIVAILLIVLVMIIIYLILRYRRKKKMKKKLQYIKLLEE
ncbi:rifin [Plasmodium falciparum NF54]|uniref:Rifin n=2 Tax=Plasmodium falciparum TaxID=5833 RepID=Q8I082_PLAF7|nr:rifin [Plasmodium falciparum 3D7]KAF4330795.1 rifin [Plasmodium falciparum NF54]PKC45194.1 rifin [Plasmodium falciparum NF54]CAD52051.1 rifin [Plasmodium falciparum 3D7]|eukprot:XP_001352241.1 rifin [Plasmodium falciparum 3D7]